MKNVTETGIWGWDNRWPLSYHPSIWYMDEPVGDALVTALGDNTDSIPGARNAPASARGRPYGSLARPRARH